VRTVERAFATALSKEIEAAVAPILAAHGMDPGRARTTYGELYKFGIEAVPVGAAKPEERNWQEMAQFYGLPADALGKEIRMNARAFKITGLNTRAPKSPVMLTEVNSGRSFKAPTASVIAALARA
jgi:hypothetical protein